MLDARWTSGRCFGVQLSTKERIISLDGKVSVVRSIRRNAVEDASEHSLEDTEGYPARENTILAETTRDGPDMPDVWRRGRRMRLKPNQRKQFYIFRSDLEEVGYPACCPLRGDARRTQTTRRGQAQRHVRNQASREDCPEPDTSDKAGKVTNFKSSGKVDLDAKLTLQKTRRRVGERPAGFPLVRTQRPAQVVGSSLLHDRCPLRRTKRCLLPACGESRPTEASRLNNTVF